MNSSPSPDHQAHVAQWINRTAADLSREQLLVLLENAMNALWLRSEAMLGEATLTAIMKRILYYTTQKYPFFEEIQVQSDGIDCRQIGVKEPDSDRELQEGIEFMLVEFLTVIGNLTAEVISSALHADLSAVSSCSDKDSPVRLVQTNREPTPLEVLRQRKESK